MPWLFFPLIIVSLFSWKAYFVVYWMLRRIKKKKERKRELGRITWATIFRRKDLWRYNSKALMIDNGVRFKWCFIEGFGLWFLWLGKVAKNLIFYKSFSWIKYLKSFRTCFCAMQCFRNSCRAPNAAWCYTCAFVCYQARSIARALCVLGRRTTQMAIHTTHVCFTGHTH